MKILKKTVNCVDIQLSTKEYEAFVELLKMRESHRKDYQGGAK